MKRFLIVLLAVAIIVPLALTGCAAKKGTAGNKFRIAVSLPPANNAWQAKMLDSVMAEVAKDTDKFEIVVKNAVDDADQQNMMQTFKEGKYDMICILPGNGTLMTQIVSEIVQGRHQGHDHRPADRGRGLHRVLRRRQRGLRHATRRSTSATGSAARARSRSCAATSGSPSTWTATTGSWKC